MFLILSRSGLKLLETHITPLGSLFGASWPCVHSLPKLTRRELPHIEADFPPSIIWMACSITWMDDMLHLQQRWGVCQVARSNTLHFIAEGYCVTRTPNFMGTEYLRISQTFPRFAQEDSVLLFMGNNHPKTPAKALPEGRFGPKICQTTPHVLAPYTTYQRENVLAVTSINFSPSGVTLGWRWA